MTLLCFALLQLLQRFHWRRVQKQGVRSEGGLQDFEEGYERKEGEVGISKVKSNSREISTSQASSSLSDKEASPENFVL